MKNIMLLFGGNFKTVGGGDFPPKVPEKKTKKNKQKKNKKKHCLATCECPNSVTLRMPQSVR